MPERTSEQGMARSFARPQAAPEWLVPKLRTGKALNSMIPGQILTAAATASLPAEFLKKVPLGDENLRRPSERGNNWKSRRTRRE